MEDGTVVGCLVHGSCYCRCYYPKHRSNHRSIYGALTPRQALEGQPTRDSGMQGRLQPVFQLRKLMLKMVIPLPEGAQRTGAQLEFEVWSV